MDHRGRTPLAGKFPLGAGQAPGHIHSRGEQPYSLTKVIKSFFDRDKTKAPYEYAMSEKLEQCGYGSGSGGIIVPLGGDVLARVPGHEQTIERLAVEIKQCFPVSADPDEVRSLRTKAMDPLNDTLGGSLVALPEQGQLIDLLRAQAVVSRAGAQQIALPPSGGINYPKNTGDPTFTWLGPSGTITDSNMNTGSLLLTAKKAGGLVKVPNDLLRYSTPAAEVVIRRALSERAALTEDLACLEGLGGTISPQGILLYPRSANNVVTADKVTLHNAGTTGTDGDTFLPSDVLRMLALIEEANSQGATAWIMRPLMFFGLANERASAVSSGDGAGPFLFPITRGAMGNQVEKVLSGVPVLSSTQVSNTRAKGSAANLSFVLAGDFRESVIGRVGAIELAASEHVAFASDATWIRALLRMDFGLRHPQAFCVSDTLVIPA